MAISLRRFHFTTISDLLFVDIMIAIGVSLLNPIWSLYFYEFLGNKSLVGFFSAILSLVALISFFMFTPVIQKFSEKKIYFYGLIAGILLLNLMTFNTNFYFFIILVTIYVMMSVLRIESFGIMYRDSSKTKFLGKNEGLIYTISNVGWIVGSFLVIFLLKIYNLNKIFLVSAMFMFLALVVFSFYKGKQHKKTDEQIDLLNNIKRFFKNKELRRLYLSSIGTSMWLGMIFVYMPLYIVESGYSKSFVGTFVFIFLLPHLIQYFIGRQSDKIGTKIFINLGYLIIGVFTLLTYFVNELNLIIFLLFLANFGVAIILPTREAHFFKSIKKKEGEKYYGTYLTYSEVGLLIGKLIPALLLFILPFKTIFLIMGALMTVFYFFSMRLKNI